jgi:hypothetical protein
MEKTSYKKVGGEIVGNNDEWNIDSYTNTFTKRAKFQPQIFDKLKDCNWH